MVRDIFQYQVAAEAGGAGVQDFGTQFLLYILQDSSEIGVAVRERDPGVFIVSVTRPVENNKGRVVMPFQDSVGELICHCVVLVPGKTVAEKNDMFKDRTWTDRVFHVYSVGIIFAGKIYFTPDREICTMKIKIFFHGDFSEKTSVRIQLYIALYHLTKPPYQTVECHYTMKPQAVI